MTVSVLEHGGVMSTRSVLAEIERRIVDHRSHAAVRGIDGCLSYGELGDRSAGVAAELAAAAVGAGDRVAVCLPRSPALAVAALAVWRVGATYVALDPAYPAQRLDWMLADCGAAAVLSDGTSAAGGDQPHLVLAHDGEVRASPPVPASRPRPAQQHPGAAYVVYTSGSTGQPKGVIVDHAALDNLVDWHVRAFSLGDGDVTTQISSPGFDASVWELWPSLAVGATIVVVPEPLRTDPRGLRDWLVDEGVTVSFIPTAIADQLITRAWPADTSLRFLLTGGDALSRRPVGDLPFRVINNYGLSETAVVATSGEVAADGVDAPSIGRPIDGVVADVVDEDSSPVAPGEAGELLLGGTALARGYLNRPELTRQRFVDTPAGRRYRTGDRVRRRPDGEIEFLGRVDDQVSVRGFRVEPGEVTAALARRHDIETSVVVSSGETAADRRLTAYLVAAEGAPRPTDAQLDSDLRRVLPEYMVPSRFVWIDAVPVTTHGKVDRDALRALADGPEPEAPGVEAPVAVVAGIAAELLGTATVGPDENIFLLGGHSLFGAQLIARVEDHFGVELTLRFVFDHPTAGEIAAEVERQRAELVTQ